MSRITLRPDTLQVESFAVAPESDTPFATEEGGGSNVSECMLTCTGCTCVETCRFEICRSAATA